MPEGMWRVQYAPNTTAVVQTSRFRTPRDAAREQYERAQGMMGVGQQELNRLYEEWQRYERPTAPAPPPVSPDALREIMRELDDDDGAWGFVEDEDEYFEWCEDDNCATCQAQARATRGGRAMPNLRADFYRRLAGASAPEGFDPTVRYMSTDTPTELANALRQAFAFFRRHDDRRYSANSKLRLLTFADKADDLNDESTDEMVQSFPKVVVMEVPYSFDEETEVKSGGVVGMAVVFPDRKVMLAVHQEKRRVKLGTVLLQVIEGYVNDGPVLWIHRANQVGQHFAIAMGLQAFTINNAGAVQYARYAFPEESDAVEYCDERELDQRLRVQQQRAAREIVNRPRRPGRVLAEETRF